MKWIRRPYAGYFRGKSRELKTRDELFVVDKLFESMEMVGESKYHSPCISDNDPPDIEAKDQYDSSIAFEVSELVDEESVGRAERGQQSVKYWGFNEVVHKIAEILKEKDSIDYGHKKFSRVVLVIYTDEYTLPYRDLISDLSKHLYPELKHINEAYLLFSFDPNEGNRFPYIRLAIGN